MTSPQLPWVLESPFRASVSPRVCKVMLSCTSTTRFISSFRANCSFACVPKESFTTVWNCWNWSLNGVKRLVISFCDCSLNFLFFSSNILFATFSNCTPIWATLFLCSTNCVSAWVLSAVNRAFCCWVIDRFSCSLSARFFASVSWVLSSLFCVSRIVFCSSAPVSAPAFGASFRARINPATKATIKPILKNK